METTKQVKCHGGTPVRYTGSGGFDSRHLLHACEVEPIDLPRACLSSSAGRSNCFVNSRSSVRIRWEARSMRSRSESFGTVHLGGPEEATMFKFTKFFSTKTTPQREPIPGSDQVLNSAGGHAWQIDDWGRLDRFLVLGSEGGTFYVGERALTIENAEAVARCLAADGVRTVDRIAAISDGGRAPKNDPERRRRAKARPRDRCRRGDSPVPGIEAQLVERPVVNRMAVGSNPTDPAMCCSFSSVSYSGPVLPSFQRTTRVRFPSRTPRLRVCAGPCRIVVNTPVSLTGNAGAIPATDTKGRRSRVAELPVH